MMLTQFKSLIDLLDYFNTNDKCKKFLEEHRWGGKIICPHCDHDHVYTTNRGYKCASKACHKKFTVTVGTIFENSNMSLRKWFASIYVVTAHKSGISSHQLAKDVGITQKTAWFRLQSIREMLHENAPELLDGEMEIDETYIGGDHRNKHKAERAQLNKKGTGAVNKVPVFGILSRETKTVQTHVLVKANAPNIKPIIRASISRDAILITDGHGAYLNLNKEFKEHIVINHKQGEFIKGRFHTNSLEGFWSLLKRGMDGIYHSISRIHLHRYCNEFAFRYNTRKQSDPERFLNVLSRAFGIRLTYNQLIHGQTT